MTDSYVVQAETLVYGKRQYRAPFKVDFTVWCPRSELLILASKRGDVILQRNGWKKCWRVSVADQCDPLSDAEPEAPRTIECITWAPSGDIIAIGMSDGHIYLMYADNGTIFWKKLLVDVGGVPVKITDLHWSPRTVEEDVKSFFGDEKGAPLSFPVVDDAVWVAGLQGIENTFRQKLFGTLLFATRDDFKVSILAGGVMSLGLIDLNQHIEPLRLTAVVIYGTYFDAANSRLSITVTTHGPRTSWQEEKILIKPTAGSGENFPQTNVLNMSIEIPLETWKLVYRYVILYNRWVHIEESLRKILKDWQTQKQIFVNRLIPTAKNLNLGACLVSFCLHGHGTHLGEGYIERLFSSNLSGLVEFVYRTFDQLASCLNGEFSEAVRMASFHMEEFSDELLLKYTDTTETSKMLRTLAEDMEKMSPSFQKSVSITVKACVHNIGELLQFIRWLSVLPVEKENKKKLSIFPQLAKLDISSELKYLIETFIDDEDMARRLKNHCFNIDKVLENERLLEKQGYYQESNPMDQKYRKKDDDTNSPSGTQTEQSSNTDCSTPHVDKTTQFRRLERYAPPIWQEKLDRVSDIWSNDDYFSVDLLQRLGLASAENEKTPNIKKQCLCLKSLLFRMDLVMQHLLAPPSLNWIWEIECDQQHQGFKYVELRPFVYSQQVALMSAVELFREKEVSLLKNGIMICGHDSKSAIIKTIEGKIIGEKMCWVLREDLTKRIQQGVSMDNVPQSSSKGGDLLIETTETQYGKIAKINEIRGQHDGFFFALVTVEKPDDSIMRHLLRCHISEKITWIHTVPFRQDQFETLSFLCKNTLACYTSDEATRVNMFNTIPIDADQPTLLNM